MSFTNPRAEIISRIVLFARGVLVDERWEPIRLMPEFVRATAGVKELTAVCTDRAPQHLVASLYPPLAQATVTVDATVSGEAQLRALLDRGVLDTDSTLLVDGDPRRCMSAIRLGIHAGIFEDAPRLYRDIGLWGFVPRNDSLSSVTALLHDHSQPDQR